MKLSVIGLGQCGGNIADEFYAVNRYARSILNRHVEILTDSFAINTDETDLGGFKNIPKDKNHRILIGSIAAFGHGVGKINTDAVEIIKQNNLELTDTILRSARFHDCDAVVAIASGGGGTGSGTIGWLIKSLKERIDKPVYAIIVLPFAFEERGDTSFAIMNTASCINTVNRYADTVFLVDNERYRRAGDNLAKNLQEINREIAYSFYDLCCAGEEKNQKYVGGKVIDAGDIRQSLGGFSCIGLGQVPLSSFLFNRNHFRHGIKEQGSTIAALHQAESKLSAGINIADARKILALLSAPKYTISISTLEEVNNYLQEKSPRAEIRMGDYPRKRSQISVTLLASLITNVSRIENLFKRAEELFKIRKVINEETEMKIESMPAFSRNIPTLE